jgi:hypothetical protein
MFYGKNRPKSLGLADMTGAIFVQLSGSTPLSMQCQLNMMDRDAKKEDHIFTRVENRFDRDVLTGRLNDIQKNIRIIRRRTP